MDIFFFCLRKTLDMDQYQMLSLYWLLMGDQCVFFCCIVLRSVMTSFFEWCNFGIFMLKNPPSPFFFFCQATSWSFFLLFFDSTLLLLSKQSILSYRTEQLITENHKLLESSKLAEYVFDFFLNKAPQFYLSDKKSSVSLSLFFFFLLTFPII